jgi:hypothetical protein
MIGTPSTVIKMQQQTHNKKIVLGKDKVAYNDKSSTPVAITPVLY